MMDTKHCNHCDRDLPLAEFSFKDKARGTRQSRCRGCFKTYSAAWHQEHKATRNPAIRDVTRAQRAHLQQLADTVRQSAACSACGLRASDGADVLLVPAPELTGGRPLSAVIRAAWSTQRFVALLEAVLKQVDGVLCRGCLGKVCGARTKGSAVREGTAV